VGKCTTLTSFKMPQLFDLSFVLVDLSLIHNIVDAYEVSTVLSNATMDQTCAENERASHSYASKATEGPQADQIVSCGWNVSTSQ